MAEEQEKSGNGERPTGRRLRKHVGNAVFLNRENFIMDSFGALFSCSFIGAVIAR